MRNTIGFAVVNRLCFVREKLKVESLKQERGVLLRGEIQGLRSLRRRLVVKIDV
jgi:hypothetical protein